MAAECGCPEVYPDWDGKDVDLCGYHVHRLPIPTFVHMPIAYELYVEKQRRAMASLGLKEIWPGFTLTRTGMLGGSLMRLLEAAQSSLSRYVRTLPCPFTLRGVLHHGNISTIHRAVREMQMYLIDRGSAPKELYICHLSCPACAERKGERILLLRRWVESPMLKKRAVRETK